ncbi:MAG: hypothetical protein PHD76_11270 [Methylacidiphilales bacterium]|nr:hypothetical protein [Candidatus Methylacidiphilales bacterium]
MNLFVSLWQSLATGQWTLTLSTPAEWVATVLSLFGFYWCLLKKPSSFLIFMVADFIWLVVAGYREHWSLVAQQAVYLVMNVAGYKLWIADQLEELRIRNRMQTLEDEIMMLAARIETLLDDEEQNALTAPGHDAKSANQKAEILSTD